MHELSLVQSILQAALNEAEKAGGKHIEEIRAKVRESGHPMEAGSLQALLEMIAKGTIAQEAKISIEVISPTLKCKECDFIFINRPLRKTKRADIEGQYFKEIRFGRLNIPVVIYDTDTTMLTIKQRRKVIESIGASHVVLANNDIRVKEHVEAMPTVECRWIPFGVNPEHYVCYNMDVRDIPSAFIGSYRNNHYKMRRALVEYLAHRMGDRFFFKRMIKEEYVLYLNRTKVFVIANDEHAGFFMKHLEAMACKSMVLAQYTPLFNKLGFVDGKHLVVWETLLDCEKLLLYYMNYDENRIGIAENGYELATKEHTWRHRVDEIIEWTQ